MWRQKKYECGDFLDIEIFQISEHVKRYDRARKVKESTPAQRNLNDKRAKRYLVRLVHNNFGEHDLYVDLTYDKKNLPGTREEVLKDVRNYVKRLQRYRNKHGLDKLKYLYVISNMDQMGNKVRYHVHMIISGMDRDIVESKWGKGYANTDRLRYDEHGVTGKTLYMARQAKGDRSWGSSTNLKKPEPVISDKAITRAVAEKMANAPDDKQLFEKRYKDWIFTDCEVEIYENDEGLGTGLAFIIHMRKYGNMHNLKV